MRKYRIIIFVSFLFVFCMALVYRNNTKELKLTKNMFGCDSPTLKGRVKFVINRTVYLPYVEKKLFIEERHPVAQYFIFYKIIKAFNIRLYKTLLFEKFPDYCFCIIMHL